MSGTDASKVGVKRHLDFKESWVLTFGSKQGLTYSCGNSVPKQDNRVDEVFVTERTEQLSPSKQVSTEL